MDAHRVDILDRADDDAVVRLVADHLHLILFPAKHALFDQHLGDRRSVEAPFHYLLEFFHIVGDAAAGSGQGEGGPDDGGQAHYIEPGERLGHGVGDVAARAFQPDLVHGVAELLAVFSLFDHLGAGADHLDPELFQHARLFKGQRTVQRRLAAHGRQKRVGALFLNDLGDEFGRDRLDIGRVGHFRIGHDGGRIGIDQNDAIAFGSQGLAGLDAGIVELTSLADDDRARADDQDRFQVRAFGHFGGSSFRSGARLGRRVALFRKSRARLIYISG